MLKPRKRQISEIHYILIAEDVGAFIPFIPPFEFHDGIIDFVRELPTDLLQIGQSLDFFESRLKLALDNPYRLQVIYSQNLALLLEKFPQDVLTVFLINCKSENQQQVTSQLAAAHRPLRYYKFFKPITTTNLDHNFIVTTPADYLKAIWVNQQHIIRLLGMPPIKLSPEVLIYDQEFYADPVFSPARNNYHISNSISGNFPYEKPEAKFETMEEAQAVYKKHIDEAIGAAESFDRLDKVIRRIKMVDHFAGLCYDNDLVIPAHPFDAGYAPLILVAPFQNPDVKFKGNTGDSKSIMAEFHKALNFQQSQNYINQGITEINEISEMMKTLTITKINFLDQMASLHASFNFSPILRLPTQGKSIYRELSFFRPEALRIISKPANRKNIHKTIRNFSKVLATRVLSEKLAKELKNKNRQLVVISDLPMEWLEIDGIPLGFSHDICRLPETALHGLMANFARNEFMEYTIPKDILSKTLVIFGSEEDAFKKWRRPVHHLSNQLGFQSRVCLSVKAFIAALEEIKPEFLIFDCHGGVNEKERTSFLELGKEMLTGEIIVKYKIAVPLVFLSACNTAPTYGTVNTIANAFFETGSMSVTTTYLPIHINSGSILYLRVLNNLRMASTQSIHPNWLSFLSYNIRTSVVSETFQTHGKSKGKTEAQEKELADQQTLLYNRLMYFPERRKVFQEMDQVVQGLSGTEQHTFANIIPEYLFYSNLGRADLIRFQSYLEVFKKKNIPPDFNSDFTEKSTWSHLLEST